MLHGRGENVSQQLNDFFHFTFIMASYKFEYICIFNMLFCCISLFHTQMHTYYTPQC